MVFSYCKCSYHLAGNENAAANFYNTHFVPDGWELVYSKLSECHHWLFCMMKEKTLPNL